MQAPSVSSSSAAKKKKKPISLAFFALFSLSVGCEFLKQISGGAESKEQRDLTEPKEFTWLTFECQISHLK